MRHAAPDMPKISHGQLAQLRPTQSMEQQGGEDRPIALALKSVGLRRLEQLARLVVADRRRLAFAAIGLRALDAFDRIVGHGILVAEILEHRGQGREAMPDRGIAPGLAVPVDATTKIVAPGDDMGAGDHAAFVGPGDAGEAHKVGHRGLIGTAGVRVGDVGEPLDLGGDVGEPVKLGGREHPFAAWGDRREGRRGVVGGRHGGFPFLLFTLDKICYQE